MKTSKSVIRRKQIEDTEIRIRHQIRYYRSKLQFINKEGFAGNLDAKEYYEAVQAAEAHIDRCMWLLSRIYKRLENKATSATARIYASILTHSSFNTALANRLVVSTQENIDEIRAILARIEGRSEEKAA